MILLETKTDWPSVKNTLSNVNNFMESLMKYDVEKTPDKVWKKARDKYISKPEFEPAAVKQVSVAAAALATWASACSKYAIVTKKVAPKKAKYAEVMEILKKAKSEL
jgi:dynein heavy chain